MSIQPGEVQLGMLREFDTSQTQKAGRTVWNVMYNQMHYDHNSFQVLKSHFTVDFSLWQLQKKPLSFKKKDLP